MTTFIVLVSAIIAMFFVFTEFRLVRVVRALVAEMDEVKLAALESIRKHDEMVAQARDKLGRMEKEQAEAMAKWKAALDSQGQIVGDEYGFPMRLPNQ